MCDFKGGESQQRGVGEINMITDIAYYPLLGKPLIMWLGILTILSLLFTANIAFLNKRRIRKIPMKYHPLFAKITIFIAVIHGFLGLATHIF